MQAVVATRLRSRVATRPRATPHRAVFARMQGVLTQLPIQPTRPRTGGVTRSSVKREDQIRRTTESRKGDVITARSTARARGPRAGVGAQDRSASATGWKTGASTGRTAEEVSVAAGASQHVIAAGATQGACPDSQGASAGQGQHDGHESMATTPAAGAVRDAIASATTAIRPFMGIESFTNLPRARQTDGSPVHSLHRMSPSGS